MNAASRILTVYIDAVPPEGTSLEGESPARDVGLEDEPKATFGQPVHFGLKLSLVRGKLLVRGRLWTVCRARCDRCLAFFDMPLLVENVCWFFEDTDSDEIDLTESVREDILLFFPQRFLCSEACKGLCVSCGANLNNGACTCSNDGPTSDPWRALNGFSPEEQ